MDSSYYVLLLAFAGIVAGDVTAQVPLGSLLPNDMNVDRTEQNLTMSPWSEVGPCIRTSDVNYCVFSSKGFNNGEGITIITSEEAAITLAAMDVWESSGLEDFTALGYDDPRYHDEEIPGKGIGLVAHRLIRRGELIMNRKPSFLADERIINNVQVVDKLFSSAFATLPPQHQKAYLNLSTHIPIDSPTDRIRGVMLSNSFNIRVKDTKSEEQTFCTTFTEVSRINHDCRPNSNYYFDYQSFSHRIYANRDILPGQEITITYVDSLLTRAKRQERLKNIWGFGCTCHHCSASPHIIEESDSRLNQIAELRKEVEDYTRTDASSPQQAEVMAELFELEDIRVKIHQAYFHAAVQWNSVGDNMTAIKYARRVIDHGMISVGPEQWIIRDMQQLAQKPLEHWSWGARERGWWRVKPAADRDSD